MGAVGQAFSCRAMTPNGAASRVVAAQRLRYDRPMDSVAALSLLRELHQGKTSRNRAFYRFTDPSAGRVLAGYRTLRGLVADLHRPGIEARVLERPGADPVVELFARCLRYHRAVRLAPWELRFLLEEMGVGLDAWRSGASNSRSAP